MVCQFNRQDKPMKILTKNFKNLKINKFFVNLRKEINKNMVKIHINHAYNGPP